MTTPEQNSKPKVEVKINPKVDWDDFAGVEDIQALLQPRIDAGVLMAEAWERYLISECLRMGVWRIWFIQWCEFTETTATMNTKVFAPWQIAEARALAKKVGGHVVGLSFKKWLLYVDSAFNHYSRSSPNKDAMADLRRVLRARCIMKCMPRLLQYRAQAAENAKFKAENRTVFEGMEVAKEYWTAFDKIPHGEVAK